MSHQSREGERYDAWKHVVMPSCMGRAGGSTRKWTPLANAAASRASAPQPTQVVGDASGRVRYDKGADVWAAGVTMYVLLCGWVPFGGRYAFKRSEVELRKIIRAGEGRGGAGVWPVVQADVGRRHCPHAAAPVS